jgi:N-methylhydantoinase A
MGVLSSDIMHTYHMSSPMVAPVDINMFSNNFDTLEKRAIDDLAREGFKSEDIAISRFVDMRFRRQTHEIPVPVPAKQLQPQDLEELYEAFSKIYEKWYGKGAAYREAGMEMINFKVEAVGKLIKPSLAKYKKRDLSPDQALKIKREVYFGASENFVSTYIYDFDLLYPGNVIQGPAVIETPVTTIVIHPNQRATIDEYKNTIIEY